MILDKITSESLHVDYPAMAVVATYCLEENSAAVYPCYYMHHADHLLVSTSVVSLIKHVNRFMLNPLFQPINYFEDENANNKMLMRLAAAIPHKLRKNIREVLARKMHIYLVEKLWYERWDTIDSRIKRLKAFHKVTPSGESIMMVPDFSLRDPDTIIEKVVFHLTDYINRIEKKFPDYKNIVLVGGKDSQLIVLVPKMNKENWIVFSSEPDYHLVKKWIEMNDIEITDLIYHDGQNEETAEETERKIIYSDLYSDPRHIRFLPTLKKIAERFKNKCLFWSGTAAGTIIAYHQDYPYEKPDKFFEVQYTREGLFQGIYHQVFKNYVDCPLLSPYHSYQIWEDLFIHLDPRIIKKGVDFRKEIGHKLINRLIEWIDENPHIGPYEYDHKIDTYDVYLSYIKENITS